MKINSTPFLIAFLLVNHMANSQQYITAAGVRAGSGIGLTVQQALVGKWTVEGISQKSLLSSETMLTALVEKHHSLLMRGINFYYGVGPHVALYSTEALKTQGINNGYGLSLVGGLEVKLGKTVWSFDYKPAINLSGGARSFQNQSGVSVRYVLIPAKKPEPKNWQFWKKKPAPSKQPKRKSIGSKL